MADSSPPGAGPDRSFDIDPVVNPLRIMFDMSEFDTGPVVDLENRDSLGVEDDNSVVRRLFLSTSRDTSPNPESLDSTPHQVTFDPSLQPDVNEEVNNNGVDVSTAPAPAVAPPQDSMPTMAGNSSQGAPRAVRQRHRKSYAKKKFHANSSLYLLTDPTLPIPAATPDLIGKIAACPNKKNDHHYEIYWWKPVSDVPWPDNLQHHLRRRFPKAELHPFLDEMIAACSLNNDASHPTTTVTTQATTTNVASEPTPLHPNETLPDTTTPGPSLNAAFAYIYTAGSSVSGVSTLTRSDTTTMESGSHRSRSTRSNNNNEDYDSDQYPTDDEDEYEVDHHENFWQSRSMTQEMVEQETYVDDQLDGDVVSCPADCDATDFARMLKDCKEFDFVELDADDMATMPSPQKIYAGETGLKQGVAKSFQTPLGAFRKCGFTLDMVKHWVTNSNRYVRPFCSNTHTIDAN